MKYYIYILKYCYCFTLQFEKPDKILENKNNNQFNVSLDLEKIDESTGNFLYIYNL